MASILIVEDDAMNCRLFELVLSRMGGHKVIAAENAENALNHVKKGDIDLVIMDISLQNWIYKGAEISGIDLTRIIKTAPKPRYVPILLATAHAMKDDKEDLLRRSSADDYFSKPINDHSDFLSKVATLLANNTIAGKRC